MNDDPGRKRRGEAKGDRIAHHADDVAGVEERLEELAGRSGVSSLLKTDAITGTELLKVLGGVRGLLETLLPSVTFVAAFAVGQLLGWTSDHTLTISLGASLGLSVVFVALRILERAQLRSATAGLLAASASAALALFTGNPNDNFLLGIIINAVYGLAMLISILVGWPLLGLFVGFLMGDGLNWRSNKRRRRVMVWLTLLWAGLFALRLTIEVPLYFAGQVVALGVAKLILGTPLYAIFLVLTWLISRAVYPKPLDTADKIS